MCRLLVVSAAVLLFGIAMSTVGGAVLSGDQIATGKGDLVIHPIRHANGRVSQHTIYVALGLNLEGKSLRHRARREAVVLNGHGSAMRRTSYGDRQIKTQVL